MSLESSFLDAIIKDPDDDTPRLVYADWLEEQGQAERAEFIRVQIELARTGEEDPRRPRLELRAQDLLTEHEKDWLGPVWEWLKGYRFERGFLHAVCVQGVDLFDDGAELFASAPVRHLSLYLPDREGLGGPMKELLACDFLPRLTRLSFWGGEYEPWLNDQGLGALAGSAAVAGLTGMAAQQSYAVTAKSLGRLAKSRHLARLTELVLRETGQDDSSLEHLARSRHLTRLEALDLGFTKAGPEGLRQLTASASFAALRRLKLDHTSDGDETARVLATSPGALEDLDLFGCGVSDAGVLALVRSAHPGRLRRLSLGEPGAAGGVGDAALSALSELPALHVLSIPWGRFTAAGLRALAASPLAGRLTELDLFNAGLDADDYLALVQSADMPRLGRLGLAFHHGSGEKVVRALGKSANLPSLHTLTLLGGVDLTAAVRALPPSLLGRLRVLGVAGSSPPDSIVNALAEAPGTAGLLALHLYNNHVTSEGLLRLASGKLPELRRLQLSSTVSRADRERLRDRWGPRFRLAGHALGYGHLEDFP